MAKLSKKELEQIVTKQLPRYRIADTRSAPGAKDVGRRTTRARPEARTPDPKILRKKYLRDKYLSDSPDEQSPSDDLPNGDAVDDEIVMVEPKRAPHPLDRGSRPKAVVISGKRKKIIGQQG